MFQSSINQRKGFTLKDQEKHLLTSNYYSLLYEITDEQKLMPIEEDKYKQDLMKSIQIILLERLPIFPIEYFEKLQISQPFDSGCALINEVLVDNIYNDDIDIFDGKNLDETNGDEIDKYNTNTPTPFTSSNFMRFCIPTMYDEQKNEAIKVYNRNALKGLESQLVSLESIFQPNIEMTKKRKRLSDNDFIELFIQVYHNMRGYQRIDHAYRKFPLDLKNKIVIAQTLYYAADRLHRLSIHLLK